MPNTKTVLIVLLGMLLSCASPEDECKVLISGDNLVCYKWYWDKEKENCDIVPNLESVGKKCAEDNPCQVNYRCTAQGNCWGEITPECDDDNPCTDDSCDTIGREKKWAQCRHNDSWRSGKSCYIDGVYGICHNGFCISSEGLVLYPLPPKLWSE